MTKKQELSLFLKEALENNKHVRLITCYEDCTWSGDLKLTTNEHFDTIIAGMEINHINDDLKFTQSSDTVFCICDWEVMDE